MKMPRRRRLPSGFWPVPLRNTKFPLLPFGLAVAAAIIAAFVMPRQSPFPYRFEKGHPWNYSTLKAPFDFEVLYPEETVREQLKQIEADHAPYYVLHPEIGREQRKKLEELLNKQIQISRNDTQFEDLVRNQTAYFSFARQLLDDVYQRGIGGPELEGLLKDNPNATIFLVDGNNERRISGAALLTPQSAQDFLTDTLPYSPLRQPELLLPFLEKILIPNVLYNDSITSASKRRKVAAVVSTGITVRKGEIIVRKTDLLSEEIYRKLESLRGRYDIPEGGQVVAGYAMLALFAFLLFFYWLWYEHAPLWEQLPLVLLPPVSVLALLCLVSFASWVGLAVAVLIPVWGLPIFLRRKYAPDICLFAWLTAASLSTFSLDWSAGWLAIQMAGAAGVFLLPHFNANGWAARAGGATLTAVFQIFVWLACSLAGKMPAALQTFEVVLFLLAANSLLLLVFSLSRVWEKGG
jgi:membrane-associated HD superfamily phosphohydrolase